MTMTLAHPTAEDLGRFVDGTLDDAGRAAVVTHIADCDECRIVVVDAAEFVEPVVVHSNRRWWVAIAATIPILVGSALTWSALRDPLTPVIEAYGHLTKRPIDARLAHFSYVERSVPRGGEEGEADTSELLLDGEVAKVLERRGNDSRTLHAKGVALLLASKTELADRRRAVNLLEAATIDKPRDVGILSDLAAALIATGDTASLTRAVDVCDRALQIDHRAPTALFNRAKALELLGREQDAITAFDRYLAVDPSSQWSNEVKLHRDMLQSSLPRS